MVHSIRNVLLRNVSKHYSMVLLNLSRAKVLVLWQVVTLALEAVEVLFTLRVTDLHPLGASWLPNLTHSLAVVLLVRDEFRYECAENLLGALVGQNVLGLDLLIETSLHVSVQFLLALALNQEVVVEL